VRIDIWADVVCPWCYIGKRRLEGALADFDQAHPDADVETVWHSFELDPSAPRKPTESVAEMLGRKYGGGAEAGRQMVAQVEAVAAEEGLVFRHAESQHVNTFDAHRLLHLALAEGGPEVQGRLEERLLATYFVETGNLADHEVLTRLGTEVGLDPERVAALLAGKDYAEAVEADIDRARQYGANGVPFFVIDAKYGVSGAQSREVFGQVLERAWADRPTE